MRCPFILLGISFIVLTFGFNPCYAGRPLTTEDAGVADKGDFQLEVAADYTEQDNNDKNYLLIFTPIYGITETMELSIEAPYIFIRPEKGHNGQGFSDINVVLKTLIIPERGTNPAFLLKTQIKLSNGDDGKGLGSGDEDVGLVAVISKVLEPFIIHANAGYTFVGEKTDDSLKDYMLYGIACEYYLNGKVRIAGELYGENDSHFDAGAFKHHILNPLIGLTYQLSEKLVLDMAFKIGIASGKKPEYGLTFGMAVNF